jgi:hypothetical protein
VVETGPVLSGDGHCCHDREDVGGGYSCNPGNTTGVTKNGEVHGRASGPVMTGGGGGCGGLWGPSKYI